MVICYLSAYSKIKWENHAVDVIEWLGPLGLSGLYTVFTIFTMPIVVLVNYSNTILGFFELAASVSRKYIVERV